MLQLTLSVSVFLLFSLKIVNSTNTVVDLGGTWYFRGPKGQHLKANVPGGIYSDLMNNKVINDVFYGYNDVDTRWVSKRNWTYTREIYISSDTYNHNVINLVFDGLDTFAQIIVNNGLVGATDNMFVQYVFDVKSFLHVGKNTIAVRFLSPVKKAKLLYENQARKYIVPPKCVPNEYQGECHVNHIRKMQASFSWDWGPAFPSVGIWKKVYLEAHDVSVIRDVTVNIQENTDEDTWDIRTTVYFSSPPTDDLKGNVLIQLNTDLGVLKKGYNVDTTEDENGEFVMSWTFSVGKNTVSLWWPNGYGDAVLYDMNIKFISEEEDVSVKTIKIGFRTVKLIQNDIQEGTSFYFQVNNVPIFAKGSNSIPINILPEKGQDPETIKYLLQSAKDVHMNMIRVWGGGTYESDVFYETADSLGIMIWQDFMFACSMYPVNGKFIKTVKDEVRHQVRRLQHHPSIVLWAANNENEAALRQNWYGTRQNFTQYHSDYVKLYVDTIREEVFKSDISRQFLTSSPTNGLQSEESDYIAQDPQSAFYGDVHYYNYMSNSWDQDLYPLPRFASEYGFQSLPSMATLRTATDNESDFTFGSDFLTHRQHHPGGNEEMVILIMHQLNIPTTTSGNFFETYVFYGQIIQAMSVKIQTEFYRIWRSNYLSNGKGLTMGALYWQLNDVWVAPTWSGIDFNNNWKMLHYYARNFFAPVIITSLISASRNVNLYVVSDLMTSSYNDTATISVYKWDSFDVINETNITVDVHSGYSKKIYTFWLDEYLSNTECGDLTTARYNCFIRLSLTHQYENDLAPDNFIYPSAIKDANLAKSRVKITDVKQMDETAKTFEITVQASGISLFVWLEVDDIRGTFSDNGFLQFTKTKLVTFTADSVTTEDDLLSAISVTHYLDTLYSD